MPRKSIIILNKLDFIRILCNNKHKKDRKEKENEGYLAYAERSAF